MEELLNTMLHELDGKSIEVVKRPLDKSLIKQRDGGFGKKLSYVEGTTIINLLNEAFGYKWSFEVKEKYIVESVSKLVKKDGKETLVPQPPYVEVLGRLTIPGIGVKEQYGTKILVGGASEQEGAAKSAATDALKKCATLVGIGLELYDDNTSGQSTTSGNSYNNSYKSGSQGSGSYKTYTKETPAAPVAPKAAPMKEADVERIKVLKAMLGIENNTALDPFVKEFTGNGNATHKDITAANIANFNKFLETKCPQS